MSTESITNPAGFGFKDDNIAARLDDSCKKKSKEGDRYSQNSFVKQRFLSDRSSVSSLAYDGELTQFQAFLIH